MESKHLINAINIKKYLERSTDAYKSEKPTQEVEADLIGIFTTIEKQAKDLKDHIKTELNLQDGESVIGETYKVSVSQVERRDFDVQAVKDELPENDFVRCVKVVSSAVKTFIKDKALLETLKGEASYSLRTKVEQIVK